MVALGCFIARSGEKALPFFKLIKCTGKFEWTSEADKAFAELKRYLTSPPIMVAPTFCEPLLLYIAVTPRTARAILVTEQDAKIITKEEVDPPSLGAPREEEAATLPVPQEEPPAAASPTEPLSQSNTPEPPKEETPEVVTKGHPIKVVTDHPLETILCNPNVTGRVAKWAIELQPFEISFETTKVIKSKALAKFIAEWTNPFADEPLEAESTLPGEEAPGL
jgi:hypothetical protein